MWHGVEWKATPLNRRTKKRIHNHRFLLEVPIDQMQTPDPASTFGKHAKDISKDIVKDIPKDFPKDIPKDVPKDIPKIFQLDFHSFCPGSMHGLEPIGYFQGVNH